MFQVSVKNALYSALYFPIILTMGSAALGIALWYGGLLHLDGVIEMGTLVAFFFYARQFFEPLNMIARRLAELQDAQASAERIFSMIDTASEVRDSDEVSRAIEAGRANGRPAGVAIDGGDEEIEEIEFRNVCFEYNPGEPVLVDFNLKVKAGMSIALVGPTGGGKSTIAERLKELEIEGLIKAAAPSHFSFMGAQDETMATLRQDTGPALARQLLEDGVNVVLLTPV